MEIKEIINNILTQVSNGAYNTIGALMVTKLLQTLSDSDNFFKGIFNRLEKEIKRENIIKKEYIIDLPRPRKLTDPDFLKIRNEINDNMDITL